MSRVVIEGCARLDIRVLNRRGWRYGAQAISFSTGQRIWLRGTPDTLKVQIFDRGPECEIPIVKSAMHFGGWREYFRCPACLMRFAILYIATHAFRCRACNDLVYRTQNETPSGRMLIKAERLWKRAGHEFSGEGQKPKWMQWRTYNQLMERADEAYGASWDTPFVRRMMAQLDR